MEGTLSATNLVSITKTRPFPTQSFLIHSRRCRISNNSFPKSQLFGKLSVSHHLYRLNCVSGEVDNMSPLSSDVILLDVRGMTCGGCSSSVKRILENQSQVSSADVNLATATATVWPVSEVKVTPNWKQVIGEELAKNLTNCGFDSNFRSEAATEGGSS